MICVENGGSIFHLNKLDNSSYVRTFLFLIFREASLPSMTQPSVFFSSDYL